MDDDDDVSNASERNFLVLLQSKLDDFRLAIRDKDFISGRFLP